LGVVSLWTVKALVTMLVTMLVAMLVRGKASSSVQRLVRGLVLV
jgi:hypothetical protein